MLGQDPYQLGLERVDLSSQDSDALITTSLNVERIAASGAVMLGTRWKLMS